MIIQQDMPHSHGPFWVDSQMAHCLMREPNTADLNLWGGACARRIYLLSTGPVATAPIPAELAERFEVAGVPIAGPNANLPGLRDEAWPSLPVCTRESIGWGNPSPAIVLVGDRETWVDQPAFASLDGAWLLQALRLHGYDEMQCYFTNVHNNRGKSRIEQLSKLFDAMQYAAPVWVALGEEARWQLQRMGIPFKQTAHPSWHRRFRQNETPGGFTNMLEKALVPRGPWFGRDLPHTGMAEDGKLDGLDVIGYPIDRIHGITPERKFKTSIKNQEALIRKSRGVSEATASKVRSLYVSGKAKTIRQAMRMAGVDTQKIYYVARAENWKAEKDEHARRKCRAFLEADVEAEVNMAKELKEMTLSAARLAASNVLRRLQENDITVTPGDLKRLVDTHISLANAGMGEEHPEAAALRELSLQEIIERATKQLQALGGPDPYDVETDEDDVTSQEKTLG